MINKTAEIQRTCAVELSKWLELWLPKVFNEQWWIKGVVENLSRERRRRTDLSSPESIRNLDLEALLRVLSRNRNALLGRGLLQAADRTAIDSMFEVRNRWEHLALQAPQLDVMLKDLNTVSTFMAAIDNGNSSCREFRKEVERLANQLRNEGITDVPAAITVQTGKAAVPASTMPVTDNTIRVQSYVRLKSDPKARGVVMSVDSVDGKAKYGVFIDGNTRTFYEGQIEADSGDTSARVVSLDELHHSLTALYINRPSSDSLYSLGAARIDFVPYQFRPVLKLIHSNEPRLLIADSVGVGKTIEAGLIFKELQARSQLKNVLIICPKPLVAERKWENEMRDKFGEEFTPVDGAGIRDILYRCNRDGVWPEQYSRAIIPYSILSSEYIDNLKNLDSHPDFDLIIVDEAHHIRNRPTQRYKAVSYFCEHADAAIFLTATPIQTDEENLFTLLNVLFPDKVIDGPTFTAMTEPNKYIYSAIRSLRLGEEHNHEAIELLRSVAATSWGRSVIIHDPVYLQCILMLERGSLSRQERVKLIDSVEGLNSLSNMINRTRRIDIEKDTFCIRDVHTLRSEFTEHQQQLHDALIDFEAQILRVLHGAVNVNFMLCMLRQQAASCIYGLAPSIESLAQRGIEAITDSFDGDTEPVLRDDEITAIVEAAASLIELSKNLRDEDTKLEQLLEIIKKKQGEPNNKIILFTTFKHTQRYLEENIRKRTGLRVGIVNGDVADTDRYNLREKFVLAKDDEDALDIMLFTEVGSEGLDYQFCDTMVNYDLPWNPMRIEQRIGRIDRRGQKSEKVHIYNCITRGTLDADIYDRCLMRIGIFKENIGDCGDILGQIAEGIEKIVFESTLTAAERAEKLEKLAENEARNLVEMQKLENEYKELFGIDMSGFTESLDRADNSWLSANAVRKLVEGYLEQRLNDGKKHIEGNMLRLNADVKVLIKEDYDKLNFIDKRWQGYLKSNSANCRICFEQTDAKNDQKAIFVNATHAFTRQAAKFFANDNKMQIALSVSSFDVPNGTYPFSLYSWEYQSDRPQVELVPVCESEILRGELLNFIQSAIQVELQSGKYAGQWVNLEKNHLKLLEAARDKFRADAIELCRFKTESLRQSTQIRLRIAEARAIESIREGEIANINAEFERKTAHFRETADRSDIHSSLILNGVITIIGGQ
jgi:SNF2 family DNA or RNA helicase